jgi:hypothetical protein
MKRVLLGCGGLLGLLVVVIVIAAIAGGSKTAGSKPAAPDQSTPKPAASARAPQTLLDVAGSGAKKTNVFQAGGDWDLSWSAKDTTGFGCYMGVTVYSDSNSPVDIAVNQQVKGQAQDVTHEHQGGRYYLDVNAAGCDWHLTVTG